MSVCYGYNEKNKTKRFRKVSKKLILIDFKITCSIVVINKFQAVSVV